GGGMLEKILHLSTDKLPKAIATGFIATTLMQSSSLVSIIIISFLSAELMALSGAIGVMLGSNIGSTTTAWIVSSLGVKVDIAAFAMPMIIFGVAFKFAKNKGYQGLGKILLGLGFVFLGIAYTKDGFVLLQETFDMSKFAVKGYLGALVYISIGIFTTAMLRSSGAAMALIITALAANQIVYINALELAIGANIGTTVTAILGAISSNANGKRVAVAHFIFNTTTALIVIVFLYQISDFIDLLALKVGIANEDYAMKLALFHTVFNLLGVLMILPFTSVLVKYLNTLFLKIETYGLKPIYLDEIVINTPDAAIEAIKKETMRLYESALEAASYAISLNMSGFTKDRDLKDFVENSKIGTKTDLNEFYTKNIKSLYGDIIHYAALSQENMNQENQNRVYDLKLASREIIEAIKNMRDLQKNIYIYLKSKNRYIKDEYNNIRVSIAKTIEAINSIKEHEDEIDVLSSIELLKESLSTLDSIKNSKIDELIRENKIDSKMATSLINDSSSAYSATQKLLQVASVLWIKDKDLRTLGVDT
ncbi:MAG: Na/Pi cotransporter family protein, partial [Campylobacteraceae bacterium]|nr:Na/Pi cotransporter family protein [Campylobacteraceae bacterium]